MNKDEENIDDDDNIKKKFSAPLHLLFSSSASAVACWDSSIDDTFLSSYLRFNVFPYRKNAVK